MAITITPASSPASPNDLWMFLQVGAEAAVAVVAVVILLKAKGKGGTSAALPNPPGQPARQGQPVPQPSAPPQQQGNYHSDDQSPVLPPGK